MTRAMCSRTSKRKHSKPSQDISLESDKENSIQVIHQGKTVYKKSSGKGQTRTRSTGLTSKENISVADSLENSSSSNKKECSSGKPDRRRKCSLKNKGNNCNTPAGEFKSGILPNNNVLCDKTNSPLIGRTISKTKSEFSQTIPVLNECDNSAKTTNINHLNTSNFDKATIKPHIPVYKSIDPSDIVASTCSLPPEKKESVYEFDEVDEIEEPLKKKKKKKIATKRKPKTGPKALTINNIKYSSTESLVSLPDKPKVRKKTKSKMAASCMKPLSCVNNLNSSVNTSCSMNSFMSQASTVDSSNERVFKNRNKLSVLQETQSENCQSPVQERSNCLNNVEGLSESMVNTQPHCKSFNISSGPPDKSCLSQNISSGQQRCYPSKKSFSDNNANEQSHCGIINDTIPSQCSAYSSTGTSHEFLSSTPCKRSSLVVRHNSVFGDSYENNIPTTLRPSTGFIKDVPPNIVIDDNYFGFDEPEELEEPLVSPIKNNNLEEPKAHLRHYHESLIHNESENTKPDLKEVIEKLKASIPKVKNEEKSEVFNSESTSSNNSITSSPISKEIETSLRFVKPPRRSYERQRRIRHISEHGKEDGDSDDEEDNQLNNENQQSHKGFGKRELGNEQKTVKKCYAKRNASKLPKAPHIPIAKQRILKEEEELERLAAQMNAQFQKIDECNLVVE